MRMRLTVHTVGCKANFADSASIAREAAAAGFEVVPPGELSDVIVVNSCTVTHRADRDSRALVRRAKRERPGAVVVMTGCYAQGQPGAKEKVPEADHWIGIADPGELKGLLKRLATTVKPGPGTAGPEPLSEHAADLLLGHRRTFIKIQDGCDFSCSYCIVPHVRGKNRSLPREDIVAKAAAAEGDGARELVLTGIHVGLYGADRGEREGLAGLVGLLLKKTSLARIRLSSIEPMEVTDALLDAMAQKERVCPHLHIPLQSGCDRTLVRMRRPYSSRTFEEISARAAARLPGAQIGTDVIAGFPGETKGDFEETVRFVAAVPVNYLHVFPYSGRAGTESAGWTDDVAPGEKKERVSRLLELDAGKRAAFLKEQVGKDLEVLAERSSPVRRELSGYSGNYLPVVFPGGVEGVGEIFKVRIVSVRGKSLAGKAAEPA